MKSWGAEQCGEQDAKGSLEFVTHRTDFGRDIPVRGLVPMPVEREAAGAR